MHRAKRVTAWLGMLALVALVGCDGGAEKGAKKGTAGGQAEAPPKVAGEPSPMKGAEGAPVTIIEVSDFQCPFCSRAAKTIEDVVKEYDGKVRLFFKHNPLPFHKEAPGAAKAAMAAARQGKFWEMHDLLFENQKALSDAKYTEFAKQLGLDMAKFEADLKDPAIQERIELDQAAAVDMGARGTPAFFINGVLLSGAKPIEEFRSAIDEQLEKAKPLQKKGLTGEALHRAAAQLNPGTAKYVQYWIDGKKPPKQQAAKKPEKKPEADTKTVWKVEISPKDSVKGPALAHVTIVEFSDFQCPFCTKVNPTIKKVLEEYPGKVRVIFKHNPLDFHKDAPLAAEASLAAGAQGKFWEMHDLLFENQKALKREDLEKYAEQLGLDMDAFRKALDEGTFKAQVAADQDLAGRVSARGTPNLYINGRQLTGAKPFEELKPVIEEEIAKAQKLIDKGVKMEDLYGELIKGGKVFTDLEDTVVAIPVDGSPTLGPRTAPVTIVEFSEFECPYCSRVVPALKKVYYHNKGRVRIVFKHFPLNFHKHAMLASEAALAAGEQGRFWEMHDALFQNQKAIERADIEAYAEGLGLDMAKFNKALDDHTFRAKIRKDMRLAQQIGVRGTPTIFVNGRKYQPAGGYTFEAFQKMLDTNFFLPAEATP